MTKRLFYLEKQEDLFYPGMFNLIKGLMMLSIILTHTPDIVGNGLMTDLDNMILNIAFGNAMITIFFILSGYGFRVTKMKKCLKTQSSQILIPYAIVAVFTICLHLFCHFIVFRYLPGALNATSSVAAGFLLGLSNSTTIHGYQIFQVGPVWFLISLWGATVILNYLMLHFKEKTVGIICTVFLIIGCLWGYTGITIPFCFIQMLLGTWYLYLGYQIRKHDLFRVKFSKPGICILAILIFLSIFIGDVRFASSYWKIGIADLILAGAAAYAWIMLFIHLNQFIFPFREQICMIGRYSLWVMCIHTVENQGLLWYYFGSFLPFAWRINVLIIYIIKLVIIFIALMIVIRINSYINKKKKQKRRRARRA